MVERKGAHSVVSHFILLLGAVLVLFPIYVALVAASHPAEALIGTTPLWFGPRLVENFGSVLGHGLQAAGGAPVWRMLLNSTIMAVGISLGKIAISLLSAFAIVYFRLPGRQVCFFLIFVTLMLPVEIRIVPTFEVANNLGLINSYPGLIFPLIASATATFLYRQFFLTIPDELLEAARIDGAGPWRFFRDVVLPLSRTNTAALFVVTFIYGWNQYLWPLLITNRESMYTVVMAIQRMVNVPDAPVEWNLVMTTALLGLLPPLLVVLGMQRLFIKGLIETEK
jgi:sn-glycerol 3-phosphate transport system permease protein